MKRKIILGVLIILLGMAMFTSMGIYGVARAKPDMKVIVSTEKSVYLEGEDVIIFVIVRNVSDKKVIHTFTSSFMADYMIDGQYQWSSDKLFAQAFVDINLIENGTYTWMFVHKSKDYYLSPGKHKITGKVVGVGEDSCMIEVVSR